MSIAGVFERCAKQGRAALIPYVMAGDPSLHALPSLLAAMVRGGADVIELGIPYSDPLADGPTIQASAQRALAAGTTFDAVLGAVSALDRSRVDVPLIAFTYYNPLFVRGLAKSAADLAHAGFTGVIVPDLPPEEADEALAVFGRSGMGLTFLVAPTTPLDRVRSIAAQSDGFVYVVSRMGVTGARQEIGQTTEALVARLRPLVQKPLAVGFGVSTADQAASIGRYADGVIVGSALIDAIAASPGDEASTAERFCSSLGTALASRPGGRPTIAGRP